MSLVCLACHSVESSPQIMRSYSSRSDIEVTCCWSRRSPPPPPPPPLLEPFATAGPLGSRVAPIPSRNNGASLSPRLTRCHAVRRDIFNDWNFEEFTDDGDGGQLCMNLSDMARGQVHMNLGDGARLNS